MRAVLNKRGVAAPVLLAVFIGLLIGVGVYTFGYARGASYMTDDPAACANCHVMRDQYESWMKGSHGKVAVCNDCHTPAGIRRQIYDESHQRIFSFAGVHDAAFSR